MDKAFTLKELRQSLDESVHDRTKRTPIIEAVRIVTVTLPSAFSAAGNDYKKIAKGIRDHIYFPMLEDPDFCEADIDAVVERAGKSHGTIDLTEKIVGYCVLAVKAQLRNSEREAWSFLLDASYWAGICVLAIKKGRITLPSPGHALAHLRHQKTRKEREKVGEFWRKNVAPTLSAQKAADKIVASRTTDLSHKKIAEIVSLLRKGETMRKA